MIWDDLIVFDWGVTWSHSAERNVSGSSGEGEGGEVTTNICEDENLYNLVDILIFYYWISLQHSSTVPWLSRAAESVCHIDRKMSDVSFPWCTLGCLVYYFSILYFSCVPGGYREKNLQPIKSPLIFHRSLNMTVLHCEYKENWSQIFVAPRQTMTNQHLFVPFDIFRILPNKITSRSRSDLCFLRYMS